MPSVDAGHCQPAPVIAIDRFETWAFADMISPANSTITTAAARLQQSIDLLRLLFYWITTLYNIPQNAL